MEFQKGENLDNVIKGVVKGPWQWKMFIITSYSGTLLAMSNFSGAFITGTPEHFCSYDQVSIKPGSSLNNDSYLLGTNSNCMYVKLHESNVSSSNNTEYLTEMNCDNWVYSKEIFGKTAVTEFNLVCDNLWKKALAQSVFMLGVLFGGVILSEISDMFGRRRVVIVSSILATISTAIVVVSNNFVSFVVLRFFSALFVTGMFLPSFVLVMECAHPDYRAQTGILYQAPFSAGIIGLAGIAYFVRNWRHLQMTLAAFNLSMLLLVWFIPESPRWLCSKGRYQEASKILQDVAKFNKIKITDIIIAPNSTGNGNNVSKIETTIVRKMLDFFTNMKKLVETPIVRRRLLILCFLYYVNATVFYGLAMANANLNTTPYILLTMTGTGDIIGIYTAAFFVVPYLGRKITLSACYIMCGIACTIMLFIPKDLVWLLVSLASIGKMFNAAAFGIAFVFAAELMPTSLRNCSTGIATMFARIGGAIVPYIIDVLVHVHPYIPPVTFGIISLAAGLMVILLPETSNLPLPESIEEIEAQPK